MKRTLLATIIALSVAQLHADNILELFQKMPNSFTPTLNSALKSELVNGYISGNDSIENRFFGATKIIALDSENSLLQLQTSAVGRVELKLFHPSKTDTIIGYINTVCTPTCSSEIRFFNTKWQPVEVETISHKAFFTTNDSTPLQMFESWDVPQLIEYSFTEKETVKAIFSTYNYLDSEQQQRIEKSIKKGLTLSLKPQSNGYKIQPR